MSAISNANRSAGGLGGGAVVAITNPVALMLKKTTNRSALLNDPTVDDT